MAMVAAGTVPGGGLAAIVAKKFAAITIMARKHQPAKLTVKIKEKKMQPKIVSPNEWVEARKQFLIKEFDQGERIHQTSRRAEP
jgi:hypothetical protein